MILFLNGSPRPNGISTTILKSIAEAASATTDIEWIDAYKLDVRPCMGCEQCRPDKNCALPYDDGHRVGKLLQECSALVVGTSTYWGNMTGPLKALFDRNVTAFEHFKGRIPRPLHRGKKAVLVTACNAPFPISLMASHGRGAIRSLKTVVKAGGFNLTESMMVSSAYRFKKTSGKWLRRAGAVGLMLSAPDERPRSRKRG